MKNSSVPAERQFFRILRVLPPRPDVVADLHREHTRDLHQVIQIVRGPRREQLAGGDRPELRVNAGAVQIDVGQVERADASKVDAARVGELAEQIRDRLAGALTKLRIAIERHKCLVRSVAEDDVEARHPVGALTVDEVADDIVRTPRPEPPVPAIHSGDKPESNDSRTVGVRSRISQ